MPATTTTDIIGPLQTSTKNKLADALTKAKAKGQFKKKKKPTNGPTSTKAAQMLKDNSANGKKLTDKQRRFFGYRVGEGD